MDGFAAETSRRAVLGRGYSVFGKSERVVGVVAHVFAVLLIKYNSVQFIDNFRHANYVYDGGPCMISMYFLSMGSPYNKVGINIALGSHRDNASMCRVNTIGDAYTSTLSIVVLDKRLSCIS